MNYEPVYTVKNYYKSIINKKLFGELLPIFSHVAELVHAPASVTTAGYSNISIFN